MAVAVFNYDVWVKAYPEFSSVAPGVADGYFDTATLFLDNTDCSPVQDVVRRLKLLNMITAHLAKLFLPQEQGGLGGAVGRIGQATQGTVSVTLEYAQAKNQSQAFWTQTQYGSLYWMAIVNDRTAMYVPGPNPNLGVPRAPGGWGRGRL